MALTKLHITNFKGIEDLEIDLHEKVNLFVGTNGCGKTAVLEALAINLSWLTNRILNMRSNGKTIPVESIKNGQEFASIETTLVEGNADFYWKIIKLQENSKLKLKSKLDNFNVLVGLYLFHWEREQKLPTIIYYPTTRFVENIAVNAKSNINGMGIYDNALSGKTNYKAFFEWFRFQEDVNNEQIVSQQILEEPVIPYGLQTATRINKSIVNKQHNPLTWATQAIESILNGYTNFRIGGSSHLLLAKDGETIQFEQLSDGEKNLIALIGDIARRLTIANPTSNNPLHGKGFILIDEIDQHLDPSWQRLIVPKLTDTFPNCQFFITTHSPQIISHVKPESVFILKSKDGKIGYETVSESYGMNTDLVLESIMGVDSRPKEVKEAFSFIYNLISDGKIDAAREKIDLLSQAIGDDPELQYAKALIIRKQAIGK